MENKNYNENRDNEKNFKKHLFLFLKNNILLIGAVFAFILLTAAWFVNNSRVQAGSATVSAAADRKFDLAAVGQAGKYDGEKGVLKSILGDIIRDGDSWTVTESNGGKTGAITSNGKGDIVWVMSGEQNLHNNSGNSTGTIEPGNSGILEFYVLSKDTSSAHDFTFTLTVKGYYTNGSGYSPMSSKENDFDADMFYKLLSGHIQFFSSRDTYGKYSGRLEAVATADGITITGLTRQTDEKETQKKVTIYWVWPYYVGDMILPDYNSNLSSTDNKTLFSDVVRSTIAGEMTGDNYYKYFKTQLVFDDDTKNNISAMVNSNDSFDPTAYAELDAAYNEADKYIGENGEYILVQLSAVMDSKNN